MAVLVVERDRPPALAIETLQRHVQMAEEGVAALLAVGQDVEGSRRLEAHRLVDRPILNLHDRGRIDLAGREAPARLGQVVWSQEAADDIAPEHGRPLPAGRVHGDSPGAVLRYQTLSTPVSRWF
jgi:hypothetical protein